MDGYYKKMLAHCDEYLASVGDSFLNLAATNFGVNAFALTGEAIPNSAAPVCPRTWPRW
jgi:hypothetical protein